MTRTIGATYAITGAITAAALLVATAATVGLGEASRAPARDAGAVPAGTSATIIESPVLPAGALQEGERIVSAELIQTASGPVQHVVVEPAPAARRTHDDDDEREEHEEHEKREKVEKSERRGTTSTTSTSRTRREDR